MAYERVSKINERIYERNVPSIKPQILLDNRPNPTKYTHLAVYDEIRPSTVPFEKRKLYNTNQDFLPGTSGPISSYIVNVDHESGLRNMFFALQKNDRTEYLPNTDSDMYQVEVVGRTASNNHPLLSYNNVENCRSHMMISSLKDSELFNNSTRQKILDS